MHRKLILLFYEAFISKSSYPHVYVAVIFVNLQSTEEADPSKLSPIPHLLYIC